MNGYGNNYLGNVTDGEKEKNPFKMNDLKIFFSKSVGIYG
tara:strand:- start:473 stop:592 length:120 start_codon:yes stop_codon:yes gene_type:complete